MPKVVDPVCGMEVEPGRATYKTVYKGRIYYFCSAHCKREFESKPDEYIRSGPRGMPP